MSRISLLIFTVCIVLVLLAFVVWPEMDLYVSGLFAQEGRGFYLHDNPFFNGMTKFVFYFARFLFVVFILGGILAFVRKPPLLGLAGKDWVFLLMCLLIGPGLMANVVFKDHWGRARPKTVEFFGGTQTFTPAGVISDACNRNCSFVSGDAAFGFFLPSFAYVVAPRRRKQVFWTAMGLGSAFATARIILGAHFLSDVLYALVLVMSVSAALHALLYGKKETSHCWTRWLPFLVNRR